MLLLHQAGSVRVGEVVRYTVTYTPSADRILPSPSTLHLKIKNTSPIPLRAAYLHGPYSLYVSAYPSVFNPHQRNEDDDKYGMPEFEPFLKAGAHFTCKLVVPEEFRETGASHGTSPTRSSLDTVSSAGASKKSVTWVIEVISQVIFSTSAAVHYEVMLSRDERSLELGFAAVAAHGHGAPAQLEDHKKAIKKGELKGVKGVYSKAIELTVEDTDELWDKPKLPGDRDLWDPSKSEAQRDALITAEKQQKPQKKQKVHLVIVTHGLHSNLSADMLYLKESIDATVAQAREDARERRAKRKNASPLSPNATGAKQTDGEPAATEPLTGGQEDIDIDEDEEEVIVRGFSGNAVKTERGIQYLGKRLAKFVLKTTYPSQPYLPIKKKSGISSLSSKLGSPDKSYFEQNYPPSHQGSTVHRDDLHHTHDLPYQYTSISFVGHSLGGLTQLYAIAYIQKHAPDFFSLIKPVNFICLASPLLGLSNENPLYVKFALDFGLVGRTGQDLGLAWRAPTLAKSGWHAMGSVFGQKDSVPDNPGTKPLLRVLPTGPAHRVLHQFRNRTLYSNVVNDGIVPLRTSCLLFLDWKGLDRVSKYRRDNGLLGTMAEWGWAELTGAHADRDISVSPGPQHRDRDSSPSSPSRDHDGDRVPQPSETATTDDNKSSGVLSSEVAKYFQPRTHNDIRRASAGDDQQGPSGATSSVLGDIFNFFRPKSPVQSPKSPKVSSPISPGGHGKRPPKAVRALERGQTLPPDDDHSDNDRHHDEARPGLSRGTTDNPTMRPDKGRRKATRGDSVDHTSQGLTAPPKTSFFESASDLLHPPIPSMQWITDPDARPRTIFHDRVYHPADIPPPPTRRPSRIARTFSSDKTMTKTESDGPALRPSSSQSSLGSDSGGMKVEERIARAYHRDLSWRKVLVKLEPDAHNNMIVRRMFANAYGWPVIKHLCDTHFSDSFAARTSDEDDTNVDRARTASERDLLDKDGKGEELSNDNEVEGQTARSPPLRKHPSGEYEQRDKLGSLDRSKADVSAIEAKHRHDTDVEAGWDSSHFFSDSDSDEEDDDAPKERRTPTVTLLHPTKSTDETPKTPAIILNESQDQITAEPEPMDTSADGGAAVPISQIQNAVDEAMHDDVGPQAPR